MSADEKAGMVIKLSADELAAFGEPSIALRDGSGYIGEMAVYHELHCVVRDSCYTQRLPSNSCRNGFDATCRWTTTTPT